MSYSVYTDVGLMSRAHEEVSLEKAREIAEQLAAQGYVVEIREDETQETVELYNVKEDE